MPQSCTGCHKEKTHGPKELAAKTLFQDSAGPKSGRGAGGSAVRPDTASKP
jgi:hypothetical protein